MDSYILNEGGIALWISSMVLMGIKNEYRHSNDPMDIFTSAFFFGTFGLITSPFWPIGLSITSTLFIINKLL